MAVWYTSDLHLGHGNCAIWRGFASSEQHDAVIVGHWNAAVRDDDVVWVLGDVSMSLAGLAKVAELKGRKHLVTGNHDKVFGGHRDAHRHYRAYAGHFESIQAFARRRVNGFECLLSHFPYSGDHASEARPDGSDRHLQYRLRDEGIVLLHGHTHQPERVSFSASQTPQIHVGVDAWGFAPVPASQVDALIVQVAGRAA